jgi:hypothetical protein
MQTRYSILSCSLVLLFGASTALAAAPITNASWNAGADDKGSVGFGIYEKEGSCEDFLRAQPLRVGMKSVKAGESGGPLQVKDLRFCLLFISDKPVPESTPSCTSGTIDFAYDAKSNEYRGKYDLTMQNKAVRRGEFRAQLCRPPVSPKK